MIKEDFAKNEYEYLLKKTKKAFENDDAYAIMDIINDKLGHSIRMIEDRSRIGDRFEAFWILKFDNNSYDLGYKTDTWGWEYYNPYKKETNNLTSVVNTVAMELIANGEWDDSPIIDDSNFKEYFEEYIEPLNTDELLGYTDIETSDTVKNNTAAFILPSGKVINVLDNIDDSHAIHNTVAVMIAEQVLRHFVNDYTNELNRCNEMLSYLTDTLGWIRINPGTTRTESRFYIVVPEEIRPTAEQYRKVLDFLDLSYDSYVNPIEVQVFAGDSGVDYHKYDFREYLPEDILKKIKQYYNVGELREDKKTKKRTKKSHTKNLGVTSGDIAADIKTFNTMMAPMGGSAACVGEGYKRPDKYYTVSDNKAEWTPEGEDWHFWSSEADEYEPQYAQAYKCKLSPKDFLDLTTSQGANNIKLGDNLWGEFKELDDFKFIKQPQPIYLSLSFKDKNPQIAYVTGHEGRHRMFGLMLRGIKLVDVMLYCDEYNSEYDRHNPFVLKQLILVGQYNKAVKVKVNDLIPMSYAEHSKIRPNIKELKNYKEGLKFDFCEDFNHRTIKLPPEALKRSIELYFDERPYEIKKVSIKKLVDDNGLLNDDDLESYHQIQWENKPAKDFSINIDKLNNMRASEIPYASERNGKLILGDGRHRVRAAYNDGYDFIELPVIKESLTEAKADIDAFINKFGEDTYTNFLKAKDRLKNKGQSVDLTWYVKNMEKKDLDNLILSLYNKDTDQQKKRIIQGTDKEIRGKYNYLGEKNGYKVYQPLDVQASMDLGVNTGWCTTGRYGHYGHPEFTPSLEEAKKHWNDYTNGGIKFYYFLDPQTMYGEYALALYPRILQIGKIVNDTYLQETNLEIYNAEDDLDYSVINKLPLDLIKEKVVVEKIDCKNGLFIDKDNVLICANKDVNDVTIPDGVTAIGEKAFEDCSFLESVTIPNSVTSIGDCAFQNCSSLTSIIIPNSVAYIGEYAFYNCFSLKSIAIPNSVTSIRDCAFSWCSSLISITIPDSVTKIGYDVFYLCPKLTVHTNNEYVIEYCEEHDIDYRKITIDN